MIFLNPTKADTRIVPQQLAMITSLHDIPKYLNKQTANTNPQLQFSEQSKIKQETRSSISFNTLRGNFTTDDEILICAELRGSILFRCNLLLQVTTIYVMISFYYSIYTFSHKELNFWEFI